MKFSIIIPVFNEEKTIDEILKRVSRVELPQRIEKDIIIVDDASYDRTTKLLEKWQKRGINYIRHNKNQGKGAAVRSGLKVATGDFIIIQDADLEYNPQDYRRLLLPMLEKRAKVVYGNRFEDYPLKIWGKDKTVLPAHWIGNKLLAVLTNFLYGSNLEDMETCYKLFTRKVLNSLDLRSERFEFEPEITAKILKKGYKIFEVPIKVSPRTYKEGKKIGWKDGVIAIWTLIKYRFVD